MDSMSLGWLTAFGATVARIALGLFVVINAAFVAVVVARRDRRLVDRWTKRVVVVDAALLLVAGAVPAATWAARTALQTATLVVPDLPTTTAKEAAPASLDEPPVLMP